MLGDPARRGIAILRCSRKAVFGRMTIADADEDHPGAPTHVTAEGIVGLRVTQDPAAAMEIDHDRMRSRCRRPIKAVRQLAVGAWQRAVDDLADRPACGTGGVE